MLGGRQAAALLTQAAAHRKQTVRQFCEDQSSVIGTATFIDFEQTGKIPVWLQSACEETISKTPMKATDMLARPVPIMGLGAADMHDLEAD